MAPGAPAAVSPPQAPASSPPVAAEIQAELPGTRSFKGSASPEPMYAPVEGVGSAPMQLFDTYLLVPQKNRLLIIDQHALHERLSYDNLRVELTDAEYAAQQLTMPLIVDVAPSQVKLLEDNIPLFSSLGIEIEHFGGNTYQVTAICHLYEEIRVPDAIYRILDELAQGDLFDKDDFVADFLRLTVEACRGAVKAGDRLTPEERHGLLEGLQQLRAPYTCPHGRPIITEITQFQMEKSFRRRP